MHLRNVPTNPDCLGEAALSNEPAIKQVFITGVTDDKAVSYTHLPFKPTAKECRRGQYALVSPTFSTRVEEYFSATAEMTEGNNAYANLFKTDFG